MSHFVNISNALVFDLDEMVAIAKTDNNPTLEVREFTITITSKNGQSFPVCYQDRAVRDEMYKSLWALIRDRNVEKEESKEDEQPQQNPTNSVE